MQEKVVPKNKTQQERDQEVIDLLKEIGLPADVANGFHGAPGSVFKIHDMHFEISKETEGWVIRTAYIENRESVKEFLKKIGKGSFPKFNMYVEDFLWGKNIPQEKIPTD